MKQVATYIMLTILLGMVGTKALANDIEVKNAHGVTIYYNYINDGKELEVTYKNINYNSYSGVVVIPDEVTYMNRTRKVTRIGNIAFQYCSGLTSVTIPNSVTSIGDTAFYGCSGLTSVTIGNSVTSIGLWAFYGCSGLTSVTIGNGATSIGVYAFEGCSGLTSVTIGNGVTSIGGGAFRSCSGLTSITIPNSVTSIGSDAFSGCSGLTSVTIGNGVTSIGFSAFCDCSGLTSVTIPNSVTSIGGWAFHGCDLIEVVSKIENPFEIIGKGTEYYETFSSNTFNNATLYVPVGTIEKYKATKGWKDFTFIEEGNGGDNPPTEPKKCEKPTISYQNGKLTFYSATEGVAYQYSITDSDIKAGSAQEIQLGVTYNISVYATKVGYENSETATATLCWIDLDPHTEGITNGVANVRALPVMIKTEGSQLTIEGADDNTSISVYTLDGVLAGSAISKNGVALVNANITKNSFAIVKIGNKSVKVLMK